MRAMFATLTQADFRRGSNGETRAADRQRVYALFDQIQIAIYKDDRGLLFITDKKCGLDVIEFKG